MTRNLRNKIKELCTGEIKFVSAKNNFVSVKLPYSDTIFNCEIDGSDDDELFESFKTEINEMLEAMINHLGDCTL